MPGVRCLPRDSRFEGGRRGETPSPVGYAGADGGFDGSGIAPALRMRSAAHTRGAGQWAGAEAEGWHDAGRHWSASHIYETSARPRRPVLSFWFAHGDSAPRSLPPFAFAVARPSLPAGSRNASRKRPSKVRQPSVEREKCRCVLLRNHTWETFSHEIPTDKNFAAGRHDGSPAGLHPGCAGRALLGRAH